MALTKRQPPANATMGGTRVTSWGQRIAELRGDPGEWYEVDEKKDRTAAVSLANKITAGQGYFAPQGSFVSAWADEGGVFRVFAMYAGAGTNGAAPALAEDRSDDIDDGEWDED